MPNTPDLLRADNQAFVAFRSRLGFERSPPARMRRDLVRPPARLPEPQIPLSLVGRPSWRFIVRLVGLKHHVPIKTLMGRNRAKQITVARQEAMFLLYTHCTPNYSELGRRFDRDHTTVWHLVRKEARQRGAMLPAPMTGRHHSKGAVQC